MKQTQSRSLRSYLSTFVFYGPLIVITLACITPAIWAFSTSFKKNNDVFSYPPQLIPSQPTVSAWQAVLNDPLTFRTLTNSIWLSSVATLVVVSLSAISGYGMSRFAFRGRSWLTAAILITQMLPPVFVLVPYYQLVNSLGIYNTYAGLLLGWCTFGVPFGTLMMRGYFNAIPVELDEAALIDGCSRLQALFKVVLPVSRAGLVGTGAVVFLGIWGDLLLVLVMTRTRELWSVVALLSSQKSNLSIQWNNLAVLAVLSSLPLVIVWIFGQKYVISGMTAGIKK